MRRRVALLLALFAAPLLVPAPAWADRATGGGYVEDGTPTAAVGVSTGGGSGVGGAAGGTGGGGGGGSSGSNSGGGGGNCIYDPLDLAPGTKVYEPDGTERVTSGPGAWYAVRCFGPGGAEISYNSVFLPDGAGGPGAPPVDPEALARQALQRLPLTGPPVATSPPPERDQLVNLATWLWVDDGWEPVSASASVPGVSVTVTAQPQSVEWAMGTGDVVACDGPGSPYDPGRAEGEQSTDCSYTYRRSSAGQPNERFGVTATQTWSVSWSASGIEGGGDLGAVSRSTSFSLRVAEGQALVTDGR